MRRVRSFRPWRQKRRCRRSRHPACRLRRCRRCRRRMPRLSLARIRCPQPTRQKCRGSPASPPANIVPAPRADQIAASESAPLPAMAPPELPVARIQDEDKPALSQQVAAHSSPTQLPAPAAPLSTPAGPASDAQSDNAGPGDEPKPAPEPNATAPDVAATATTEASSAPSGSSAEDSSGFDISTLEPPERRPSDIARTQLQSAISNQRLKEQQRLWAAAAKAKRKEAFEAYLRAFPQGAYAGLARRRLATLKAAAQASAEQEHKRRAIEAAAKRAEPKAGNVALAEQSRPPVAPTPPAEPREQSPRVRWPSSDEPFADSLPGIR